ncbi:MAG: hypothetical protein CUN55_03195 [Phototrophicales bacterium]|nr:MAG: hypothetical protein CUN55_03195 [Phototrophicales bacterium]
MLTIQSARQFFKTSFVKHVSQRLVGIEYEYPMVQLANGEGTPYEVVLSLYDRLAEKGWQLKRDGTTQVVIEAHHPYQSQDGRIKGHHTITTDAGIHTLEIGLAPSLTLQESEVELKRLIELVLDIIEPMGATLLGYGIQPVTLPTREKLAARGRYSFLAEEYTQGAAYMNDLVLYAAPNGEYGPEEIAEYGIFTLSAAGQTHVDVARHEAISVVNALNLTSGLRIALFANSPVWKNEISSYKANRELFWEWGWRGRENQTGIPPRFQSLDHYLDYLFDFRGFMIQRGDQYYKMDSSRPFRHFFTSSAQKMKTLRGDDVSVEPRLDDIHFQCGVAWFTARLQSAHGTVEDRCPGNQPPYAHLSASALALGLVENHQELSTFADQFSHDLANVLRLATAKYGLAAEHPEVDIRAKAQELVEIAQKGLQKRGFGEESYLDIVQERLQQQRCTADESLDFYHQGGVQALIEKLNMRRFLE